MKTVSTKVLLLSFLLLVALSSVTTAQNQNSLSILNPQAQWQTEQGTFEEVFFSVEPKGIYTEVGMYLTISARGWRYGTGIQLEAEMNFTLPEGSIVFDSWLWVEDVIIRGKILDRWTASRIYEDIVNRQRDPSILFKNGANQYALRIYPLISGQSRKVKISFLVPNNWSEKEVIASLPSSLISQSRTPVANTDIVIIKNDHFTNPRFENLPIAFTAAQDSLLGDYFIAGLTSSQLTTQTGITFDSPMKNGVFMGTHSDGDENLYQLVFHPRFMFDKVPTKNVAVLIDQETANSSVQMNAILPEVKRLLHEELSDLDSFNLFFSHVQIKQASTEWIPADSASIEAAFSRMGSNPVASYSNLPSLLSTAIEFLNEQHGGGSILLISSSQQVGDFTLANNLLSDLEDLMEQNFPIHIFNFQNQSYNYRWANGVYYYGNDYFYENLTRMTSGEYRSLRTATGSWSQALGSMFSFLERPISLFDMHTTMDDGFCYARYNLNNQNVIRPSQPFMQVGKYEGQYPFIIETAGLIDGQIRTKRINLQAQEAIPLDTLAVEAWTGNYIAALEAVPQNNQTISTIIQVSIEERVLSLYTAFLCLEPSQGGEPCIDCFDETIINTGTDDPAEDLRDSLEIAIAPNPFSDVATIDIEWPESLESDDMTVTIHNAMGMPVRVLEIEPQTTNKLRLQWDATATDGSKVTAGMYIVVVRTPAMIKSQKLLYLPGN